MDRNAPEPCSSTHASPEDALAGGADHDWFWEEQFRFLINKHNEDFRSGRQWSGHRDPSLPRVSLASLLADCRRDDAVSGLRLGLGSLAQRYFLPSLFLEANQQVARKAAVTCQRRLKALRRSQPGVAWHCSGSFSEGLMLAAYAERRDAVGEAVDPAGAALYFNVPDIDVMRELTQFAVSQQPTRVGLYMDRSLASHAGYTRVAFVTLEDEDQETHAETGDTEGVTYLPSDMDELHGDVSEWNTSSRLWEACRTGPAFNVNWNNTISATPGHPVEADLNIDLVTALPLTEMLPEVSSWLERVGADGVEWPKKATQEEIREHGRCFLVGTGHPSSERRDLEWRISFSDMERRLAHSLSHLQRKIYMTVKVIHKCYLKQPKVLCTYHIKTVMFWELEESASGDWTEENLFPRTLSVLDRLQRCLEQHNLPSFFMPNNNLISRADAADVSQVLTALRQIRQRPLQHIYGVDERLEFRFSTQKPLSIPLRELLSMAEHGDSVDGRHAQETLAVGLLRLVPTLAGRDVVPVPRLCLQLLQDAWSALRSEDGGHPICDHWATFAAVAIQTDLRYDVGIALMEVLWAEFCKDEDMHNALSETERRALTSFKEKQTVLMHSTKKHKLLTDSNEKQRPLTLATEKQRQLMDSTEKQKPLTDSTEKQRQLTDSTEKQRQLMDSTEKQRQLTGSTDMTASSKNLDERMQAIHELMFSDAIKGKSPVVRFLLLHHAGLILIRDMDAEPDVTAYPPLRSAAMLANLKLIVVDLLIPEEFNGNIEKATHVVTQLAYYLANQKQANGPQAFDSDSLQQALQDASVSSEQTESIMAGYNTFCERINLKQEGENFETDSRVVQVIPLHNLGTYVSLLSGGLSEAEVRQRHASFFAMSALLRKHGLAEAAAALHFRMDCIIHYSSDQEMARVTFDLSGVPMYLSTLPEPVQQLLRLTSCRAPLGAAYIFDSLVAWRSCRELRAQLEPQLLQADVDMRPALLQQLEHLAEPGAPLPPDVALTHLVILLCALHVAGDDTGAVLNQIRDAAGPEAWRRARRSLRRWKVAPVASACSPCASACSPCACRLL